MLIILINTIYANFAPFDYKQLCEYVSLLSDCREGDI
jgi:hypothetical protein